MKESMCFGIKVQGTFEFEVQPLREYFCAKYLYKSISFFNWCGKEWDKTDRFLQF
jgi:hypothetical protein